MKRFQLNILLDCRTYIVVSRNEATRFHIFSSWNFLRLLVKFLQFGIINSSGYTCHWDSAISYWLEGNNEIIGMNEIEKYSRPRNAHKLNKLGGNMNFFDTFSSCTLNDHFYRSLLKERFWIIETILLHITLLGFKSTWKPWRVNTETILKWRHFDTLKFTWNK